MIFHAFSKYPLAHPLVGNMGRNLSQGAYQSCIGTCCRLGLVVRENGMPSFRNLDGVMPVGGAREPIVQENKMLRLIVAGALALPFSANHPSHERSRLPPSYMRGPTSELARLDHPCQ